DTARFWVGETPYDVSIADDGTYFYQASYVGEKGEKGTYLAEPPVSICEEIYQHRKEQKAAGYQLTKSQEDSLKAFGDRLDVGDSVLEKSTFDNSDKREGVFQKDADGESRVYLIDHGRLVSKGQVKVGGLVKDIFRSPRPDFL